MLVQSDGLTGRLIGNDVVLNHPTVSRTRGIKELASEFWIFNLSTANGTILNGELIDSSPLADGDIIQMARSSLRCAMSKVTRAGHRIECRPCHDAEAAQRGHHAGNARQR